MKIKTFKCYKGHEFLLWEECPFCCAIENTIPNNKSSDFLQIYDSIKDLNAEEIDRFYRLKYIPQYEPETQLSVPKFD